MLQIRGLPTIIDSSNKKTPDRIDGVQEYLPLNNLGNTRYTCYILFYSDFESNSQLN